jgi:RNA polymerase sigma-70 factor (ECF subfamily)
MQSFGVLLEEQIPRLRRYAMALARDRARADDLVQDCLVRALEKAHLWEPGTNLRAWLFTILHNQHVNDVRRRMREGVSTPIEDTALPVTVSPSQESACQLKAVDRAMAMLPQEQRATLLLIGLEGFSYEEAAEILRVPVGTIRSRLSRGRATLRELLDATAAAA